MKKWPKFRMFRIFMNINSISYSFRSIANQNGVRYSDSTSYFKKYSSSKCKQTVCLHYGLDFHFNVRKQWLRTALLVPNWFSICELARTERTIVLFKLKSREIIRQYIQAVRMMLVENRF